MINNSSYTDANNFSISKIQIRGTSTYVLPESELISLTIHESLKNFVDGNISFSDQAGIVDVLNMTGNELIDIEFNSKSKSNSDLKFSKTFRICNFQRYTDELGINEYVQIDFCNQAIIENNLIRKSQAFSNLSASQIIQNILSQFSSLRTINFDIEETLYTRDYVSPIQRPFDIIQDIMQHCSSKQTKSCTMFFYEDRDGIKFKSLGSLKLASPKYKLIKEGNAFNRSYKDDELQAQDVVTRNGSNLFNNTERAWYGCRTIEHSLINKTVVINDLTESEFTGYVPLMNDHVPLRSDDVSNIDVPFNKVNLVSGDGFYESDGKVPQGHVGCVSDMEKSHIITKSLYIKIAGCTNITVGDTITLSHITLSDDLKSKTLSGVWLITNLKHILTQKEFYTEIEVLSDSDVR